MSLLKHSKRAKGFERQEHLDAFASHFTRLTPCPAPGRAFPWVDE